MKCSKCKAIGHTKRRCTSELTLINTVEEPINIPYRLDENDISDINNTTPLVGNTFKNIDELKSCTDSRKVILYITHLKPGSIKDYLTLWLYESHYSRQSMRGNLTDRIKKLNNGICYTQLMKQCFNAYDIKRNMSSTTILDTKAITIVKELYDICSSMCGSFIDYLIRRILCEITNRPFSDSRANKILKPSNIITSCPDTNIWEHIDNRNQGVWTMRKDPILSLPVIGEIKQKDTFIGFEKKNEWLRIDYNGISGWVRWKLPKEGDDTDDINLMIENPYLKIKDHICSSGCKYIVEQTIYFGKAPEYINCCGLKSCQYISYEKVKDTEKYMSKDILYDIFAISLCHTEAFGFCPKEVTFDAFHTKLNDIVVDDLIGPLTEMCKTLIDDKTTILLNPALGGPLNHLENTSIPSDADLVIDDTLYDIKCTRTTNTGKEYYEILQLLGYSGLLLLNKKFEHRINTMATLNILEGTLTKYNISYLEEDNFVKYIQQLNNPLV
jgi:hypothetical protein